MVSVLFVVVGLINLLPVTGAVSGEAVQRLYDLEPLATDVSFLMRHRAFLFSIVGLMLILAAFKPRYRPLASLAGLASMASYVVLFALLDIGNPALARVAWVDIVGIAMLCTAIAIHYRTTGGASGPS